MRTRGETLALEVGDWPSTQLSPALFSAGLHCRTLLLPNSALDRLFDTGFELKLALNASEPSPPAPIE